MICFALTGGIACGKSFLGGILSGLGVEVVDADEIVRAMHAPGGKAADAVRQAFGPGFLGPDGATDRRRLGELVFADDSARRRLESLLHPLVRQHILDWKASGPPRPAFRCAQIPLLFESGWEGDWDATVTIESPLALRLERLAARGLSREEALRRIAAQLPESERRARADFTVENDCDEATLRVRAADLLQQLRKHGT